MEPPLGKKPSAGSGAGSSAGQQQFSGPHSAALSRAQEALTRLDDAHQQELLLREREAEQLRVVVAQLSSAVKASEAARVCARIDEPDMQEIAAEVAMSVAGKEKICESLGPPASLTPEQLVKLAYSPRATGSLAVTVTRSAPTVFVEDAMPTKIEADCPVSPVHSHHPHHHHPPNSPAETHTRPPSTLRGSALSLTAKVWSETPSAQSERMKMQQAQKIRRELEKFQSPAEKRLRRIKSFGDTDRASCGPENRTLAGAVEHPAFDSICAIVIIINSFLVGYDVETRTVDDATEAWVEVASYSCSALFLVELLMRMMAVGPFHFFTGEHYIWSCFDTLLVAISIADFILERLHGLGGTSANVSSGVKTVKMLRIARIFRVFRFFKELSLLALMILDSMKSLMWALLMLSIILYVFAILFTQLTLDYIRADPTQPGVSELDRQFGSIAATLYSLLQAMLGGVSWGVASDALLNVHASAAALFFFYIFFTMLAFLNITTGVFVDNAVETARTQRDFLVQKETALKEKYLSEMRNLFSEMDEDGSGTVSLEEVSSFFQDPRVQSYFTALGLESTDAERLFSLLDTDLEGDVSIDQFLAGCLRLKGLARSIDVHQLLLEVKKVNKVLTAHPAHLSSVRSSRPPEKRSMCL